MDRSLKYHIIQHIKLTLHIPYLLPSVVILGLWPWSRCDQLKGYHLFSIWELAHLNGRSLDSKLTSY